MLEVVISGVKQSESGKELVVRLRNPFAEEQRVMDEAGLPTRRAQRLALEEKPVKRLPVGESRVKLTVPAKRIETIALAFRH